MLYLIGSTRPDIVYTVHQCTRFSHNPKGSHEIGATRIVRYLKGTGTKGIIMSPDKHNLCLDLFVDIAFFGLVVAEDRLYPVSV